MRNNGPKYDWMVVGAGLFGAVFSHEMHKVGKSVLVNDRRKHIGGNCWTRNEDGINVHEYGAHIFRTSRRDVWDYIRKFAEFNHFVNSPIAKYHGTVYNMPFNMNTFSRLWNIATPAEALAKIEEQRKEIVGEPKNLEEKAISLVGRDVYEILVKEYTEKQWGRSCADLPASILRRLPVRLTYDNNYFNDPYQGIPIGGYAQIFELPWGQTPWKLTPWKLRSWPWRIIGCGRSLSGRLLRGRLRTLASRRITLVHRSI